jgi:hypothetical protein
MSTIHEAPRYAVFSILLSLHSYWVQISSSAPCSQTPAVYFSPLMSESKFHTRTKPQEKLQSCTMNFIIQFNSIIYYLCAESTATRPITDTAQRNNNNNSIQFNSIIIIIIIVIENDFKSNRTGYTTDKLLHSYSRQSLFECPLDTVHDKIILGYSSGCPYP